MFHPSCNPVYDTFQWQWQLLMSRIYPLRHRLLPSTVDGKYEPQGSPSSSSREYTAEQAGLRKRAGPGGVVASPSKEDQTVSLYTHMCVFVAYVTISSL